jgi:diguanylate cyclase (GGDEF)-like protein
MLRREASFRATERYIEQCRERGGVLAVMLLRLRRFREFNIHFGYENGDRLVAAAFDRARQALRPVDEIIQIGACDFAILLPDLHNPDHATLAASRMIRLFQEPIALNERSVVIDVAIGVALCPEHGTTADGLFRCAERAFTLARQSIDRYAVFDAAAGQSFVAHEDLYEAVINNRLELYLQPLWDLRLGRVAGVECLSRWNSPRWGVVEPSVFIPLAEQTGLITPLTRWSLNNSLHHCAQARRRGLDLPFSINLSPRVFSERGMVEQILGALRIWDVPPEAIILEVTETAVMDDPQQSARLLYRLRDEGLRIAIDDFGIGHSTFAYLQNTPATELKIDKSFVSTMLKDQRTRQLVHSMIDLAKNLGLEVAAEGVEDAETMQALSDLGCDYVQGYFIGRPQPALELLENQSAKLSASAS